MSSYTTRYTHYARVHGRTLDEMAEYDRERYPGGQNVGFINWCRERWAEHGRPGVLTNDVQAAFDEWLGTLPVIGESEAA